MEVNSKMEIFYLPELHPAWKMEKTAKVAGLQHDEIAHGSTEFIVLSAREPEFDEDYLYYFLPII